MELYEKYIGHDNNRDSYMMNVHRVARASAHVARVGAATSSTCITSRRPSRRASGFRRSPIPSAFACRRFMAREINTIGTRIAQELDANGQTGAAHALATFDAWYPGYIDYMPMYQNIPAWWTETQGGNCATPRTTHRRQLPAGVQGRAPDGALSRARGSKANGACATRSTYMVTASTRDAALRREVQGRRAVQSLSVGPRTRSSSISTSAPYAYIIPQDAARSGRAGRAAAALRVSWACASSQLDRDIAYDGTTYPEGHVGHSDGSGVRAARPRALRGAAYPRWATTRHTMPPDGRCPSRWASTSSKRHTPLSAEFRAALKPVPPGKAVDWHTDADAPFTTNATAAGIVPRAGRITGTRRPGAARSRAEQLVQAHRARAGRTADAWRSRTRRMVARRTSLTGVAPAKLDAWATELWVTGERTSGRRDDGRRGQSAAHRTAQRRLDGVAVRYARFLIPKFTPPICRRAISRRSSTCLILPNGIGGLDVAAAAVVAAAAAGGGGGAVAPLAATPTPATRAVDDFVRAGGTVLAWGNGASSIATGAAASRAEHDGRPDAPRTISPARRSCR